MSVTGNFIDNSADHDDEILRIISECFDYGESVAQKPPSTKRKIGGRGEQSGSSVAKQQPKIKRAKGFASKGADENTTSTSGRKDPQESASTSTMAIGVEKCKFCPFATKYSKLMKSHMILFHCYKAVSG